MRAEGASAAVEALIERNALAEAASGAGAGKYVRFVLAALGSVPWVGGLLAASAALQAELEQNRANEMQQLWLREHEYKLAQLNDVIAKIIDRFEEFGDALRERIESEEYLSLVRQSFKAWDQSETQEKKELIRKLLSNAGATRICSDDVIRLFISWIALYHEAHFAVIREIYLRPNATRAAIWEEIYGDQPREDSAEADLFKLLIRDLSTGSVIRQERPVNAYGQFIRRRRGGKRTAASPVLKSAFDDEEPYVLTELGKQFVHYAMDEVVTQIGGLETT